MENTTTRIVCRNCGLRFDEDDMYTYDGHAYCEDCHNELFASCEDCGNTCYHEDMARVNPSTDRERFVCLDCLDGYTQCSGCQEYFSDVYIDMANRNSSYCADCSVDRVRCYECGDIICTDDAYCDEYEDEYYCSACWYDGGHGLIHSYGYKPEPIFCGVDDSHYPMYMGVELEIDKGDNRSGCAHDLIAVCNDIYLKEDGSLYDGIEIVSHPATFTYHDEVLPWKKLMDIALSHGFKSHEAGTCGLHIHVSRTAFGVSTPRQDLNIAKLLVLANNMWDQLVLLSRRNYRQLDNYARKVELEVGDNDSEDEIVGKAKNCSHKGRFFAVNLENYSTVEFRLYRGTLKYETFLATLQLTKAMRDYVLGHTLPEVQATGFDKFSRYCQGASQTNRELLTYITERGL